MTKLLYDPMPTKYAYPKFTDGHYLVVKKNNHAVFDENFVYVDKSKKYRRRANLMRIATVGLAFPVMKLVTNIKIVGRKNIKKHKELFKNGVVSVSNHVHLWDYIGVMMAVAPFRPYHPSWDVNCRGENKTLIRYNGGIPVPVGSIRATREFSKAIHQLLEEGNWYHTYAEGSMWEYYQPIRPFKKGAFHFAVDTNKPVLPMAFSYRKPKGLARLIWRKPFLTLTVGEPLFVDKSLSHFKQIEDLAIRAHQEVCRLAGINPEENIYPPLFENTKRVDYYPLPNAEPLDD